MILALTTFSIDFFIYFTIFIKKKKAKQIIKNHQKSSGGATKLTGGNPVVGSVPVGRRKRRICGSGL